MDTSRSNVMANWACPECGAEAGEPCRRKKPTLRSGRPRVALHRRRWIEAGFGPR